jgi:glycogen synthase
LRVALLTRAAHPFHEPGGLERAVYHLAKHLGTAGVDVTLFTRPATRHGLFPGETVFIPYDGVNVGAHGRILDRSVNYPRFASRLGGAVAEGVRQGRIDIVHAQGIAGLGYGRRRTRDRSLRAPLLMNPQGMEEHKTTGVKGLALARLRALSREAARLSDRVIATDEATRDEVPRYLGVSPDKVAVLPNGIDADEIREATPPDWGRIARQALPSLKTADPVFLSVGRIEAYKGFGDTLDALEVLAARGTLPPTWAWVVVGDGRYAASLVRRRRHGIARHLLLAGRTSETLLHALYARADIFVHATRYEGSSLVTLEAMAHGLPVIATRAGGIPDKVDDSTGRLVEPGDTEAIVEAVSELVGSGALRRKLGRAGQERALERFAWPAIARKTIALYEELLAR